jgi:hypothetical protein
MNDHTQPEQATDPKVEIPVDSASLQKSSSKVKWIIVTGVLLALVPLLTGIIALLANTETDDKPAATQQDIVQKKAITTYDDCVAAGNPILESSPEQCSADGETFINQSTKTEDSSQTEETKDICKEAETLFQNKTFGAQFCYPAEWGTASVMDAKIDTADTGHREAVRFSGTIKFIVGGVSDDWTTTVGRDVGCQEPSNQFPELSSYNTDWHDTIISGGETDFSIRSLVSSEGGYAMTEEVNNILNSGICVRGHKVINGSRYRVLSAAYYTDFGSGITSADAHIANPNALFTPAQRAQLDRLLATVSTH